MGCLYGGRLFHVQLEDDHYQTPKHVVVRYVENTLYSTNKYSWVRPVHTLYTSYFIEHNGGDELHDVFISHILVLYVINYKQIDDTINK